MTDELIHGHAAFREKYFDERHFLRKLAKEGQNPKALFIGCSDSRVVPELLTTAAPGDLFVLRNIANHVPKQPAKDTSVGAAIEYAVMALGVPDIIVCGHYGCGGVKAALEGLGPLKDCSELSEWIDDLKGSAEKAKKQGHTGDALWRAAVEEHVLDSVDDLITFKVVKERLDAGKLHIHAWVYDLHSQKLSVFDAATDKWADALELGEKG